MTWSLIAWDEHTGELGIAVATRFFGGGARVPFIAPKIGAIATPARVNPYYGIDGLRLLREGNAPDRVLAIVLKGDSGRDIAKRISSMPKAELLPIRAPLACTGLAIVPDRDSRSPAICSPDRRCWNK